MDRKEVLLENLKVDAEDIQFCFISNFFVGPIEGLLYMKKSIYRFCCFPEDVPEQRIYVIIKLTEEELNKAMAEKMRFEKMVGTYFSFDPSGATIPDQGATEASAKIYYEPKSAIKGSEGGCSYIGPFDREIIAWFDMATATKKVDGKLTCRNSQ